MRKTKWHGLFTACGVLCIFWMIISVWSVILSWIGGGITFMLVPGGITGYLAFKHNGMMLNTETIITVVKEALLWPFYGYRELPKEIIKPIASIFISIGLSGTIFEIIANVVIVAIVNAIIPIANTVIIVSSMVFALILSILAFIAAKARPGKKVIFIFTLLFTLYGAATYLFVGLPFPLLISSGIKMFLVFVALLLAFIGSLLGLFSRGKK